MKKTAFCGEFSERETVKQLSVELNRSRSCRAVPAVCVWQAASVGFVDVGVVEAGVAEVNIVEVNAVEAIRRLRQPSWLQPKT